MAAILRVIDDSTPKERIAEFVHHYPDNFLACRGDRHSFPPLMTRGRLSKGIRTERLPNDGEHVGVVLIEATCSNCGRTRWKLTGNHGVYEPGDKWHYKEPRGYKAPKGLGASKADFTSELYRRLFRESA